jgi:hypothetical protein
VDNFPCERPAKDGRAGHGSKDGCIARIIYYYLPSLAQPKCSWIAQPAHPCAGVRRENSPLDCFLFPAHPWRFLKISAPQIRCFSNTLQAMSSRGQAARRQFKRIFPSPLKGIAVKLRQKLVIPRLDRGIFGIQ